VATSDKIDSRLKNVYDNPGDKQALFDDWASTYDRDLVDDLGYVADAEACRLFISLVTDRQARILDAGCGTGLVGRRLKQAGYTDIHGNDYSEKMLDEARATDTYQSLEQHLAAEVRWQVLRELPVRLARILWPPAWNSRDYPRTALSGLAGMQLIPTLFWSGSDCVGRFRLFC